MKTCPVCGYPELDAAGRSINCACPLSACPPKAERSEALPGCPPSATGSAGVRASAEAGADSSGRSADKAARLHVQIIRDLRWLILEHHSSNVMRDEHYECFVCTQKEHAEILDRANIALMQAALTSERERACLPNGGTQRPPRKTNDMKNTTDSETATAPAVACSDLLADMELVHRQLHCVKHLCKVVSELAEAKINLLPRTVIDPNGDMGHHLIKMDGSWTNFFMQEVGEMLNNMGANDPEEDKRWDKTFEQAGARWNNLTDELNAKSANDELKHRRE